MPESYTPPESGWRTFLVVWATQSVSVFGSQLTGFALNVWLTVVRFPDEAQKPQLAAALAALNLAWALPTILGAPIAGAWADRHDRKRIMMVTDCLSGLLSLMLATMALTQTMEVWRVVLLQGLFAAVNAFHYSAFDSSYSMLVPKPQLSRANGMMQTTMYLSGILGAPIAAVMIAIFPKNMGMAVVMGVDALTYFGAAVSLIPLFVPSPQRAELAADSGKPKQSLWADVAIGARYIWHRRPMLWLLGTFTVANFTMAPLGVLAPLVVKFNLAASWTALGMDLKAALATLTSVMGVGGVVGGLLISGWGGLKRRRVYGVVVPILVSGAAMMVFGLVPVFIVIVVVGSLQAVMGPLMNAHSQAIWQTQTPRELQGRVFAVRRVIAQSSWPFSTFLAGLVGGLFDPGAVVAVLGAILVAFCVAQLFNPYLLRVEDKEYLDALAARYEVGRLGLGD